MTSTATSCIAAATILLFAGACAVSAATQVNDEPSTAQPSAVGDPVVAEGMAAYDAGSYQRAMALFTRAEAARPDDAELQFFIAQTSLELKDRARGLAALERVAKLRPELTQEASIVQLRTALEKLSATPPRDSAPSARPMGPPKTEVVLACAVAQQLMAEARDAATEEQRRQHLASAQDRLLPVLRDPRLEDPAPWRLAAVIAAALKDERLAPYAFEAVDRLDPSWADDPSIVPTMATLDRLGARSRVENIRGWRAYLLELLPKAEGGDEAAMANVGHTLRVGFGAPPDPTSAAAWYRRVAERGNTEALRLLGVMHRDGEGVPKDLAEARKLFELAVEAGDTGAMVSLAGMLESAALADALDLESMQRAAGRVRAEELYRRAARAGNWWAQKLLRERGLDW